MHLPSARSRPRSRPPRPRLAAGVAGTLLTLVGPPVAGAPSAEALTSVTSAPPARPELAPTPRYGVWPLDPRPTVVRRFEPPASPWAAGHRGVDLLGRVGQPVHSAEPGRVSFAARIAGRGVVVVDHGRTRTTYEPVAATVRIGDPVAAGSVLGRLELLGSHCFPAACLHWGLVEGREHYLDPLSLVGGGPVRLLPLGASPDPLGPPSPEYGTGGVASGRPTAVPRAPAPWTAAPSLPAVTAATMTVATVALVVSASITGPVLMGTPGRTVGHEWFRGPG